jgi:hypothetical protein
VIGLTFCAAGGGASSSSSSEGDYLVASLSKLPSYFGELEIHGDFKFTDSVTADAGSAHRQLSGGAAAEDEEEEVHHTPTVRGVTYSLSHLEISKVGGWHVHAGTSCDDPGGHYLKDDGYDPWSGEWHSDVNGTDYGTYSLEFDKSLLGHTVVVHLSNGTKAACGVIEAKPSYESHAPTTDAPIKMMGGVLGALLVVCAVFFIYKSAERRAALEGRPFQSTPSTKSKPMANRGAPSHEAKWDDAKKHVAIWAIQRPTLLLVNACTYLAFLSWNAVVDYYSRDLVKDASVGDVNQQSTADLW